MDLSATDGEAALQDVRTEVAAHFSKIGAIREVPKLRAYGCDVTQEDRVKETLNQIVVDFGGRVDVLVTAAGIVENFDVESYPLDRWKRLMDVSLYTLCERERGKRKGNNDDQVYGSLNLRANV